MCLTPETSCVPKNACTPKRGSGEWKLKLCTKIVPENYAIRVMFRWQRLRRWFFTLHRVLTRKSAIFLRVAWAGHRNAAGDSTSRTESIGQASKPAADLNLLFRPNLWASFCSNCCVLCFPFLKPLNDAVQSRRTVSAGCSGEPRRGKRGRHPSFKTLKSVDRESIRSGVFF